METIVFIGVVILIIFVIKNFMSGSHKVNENEFEQAGVRVVFDTGKITIKGKTYDVDAVQGISSRKISSIGTEVTIKVDDFAKPIHRIGVTGFGGEGEKFVQRLETALRKAGGPDFY